MEFRKDVKNRYFIYYLATVIICFVLGYVLLEVWIKYRTHLWKNYLLAFILFLHNSEC